ncbi:MAG: hypothetical protein KC621_17545 [Myxococcales bacterium]|nr:hypothetical protein [Myxococcales bacterium]
MEHHIVELLRESAQALAAAAELLERGQGAVQARANQPLTSWSAVADAVGVSVDTLLRRRREHGIRERRPWFGSEREAREWYAALGRAPPLSRRRPGGR